MKTAWAVQVLPRILQVVQVVRAHLRLGTVRIDHVPIAGSCAGNDQASLRSLLASTCLLRYDRGVGSASAHACVHAQLKRRRRSWRTLTGALLHADSDTFSRLTKFGLM